MRNAAFGDQAVDDDFDRVVLVAVHRDLVAEVVHGAVDAYAHEAGAARIFEDALVLALAVLDHRREQHDALTGGHVED